MRAVTYPLAAVQRLLMAANDHAAFVAVVSGGSHQLMRSRMSATMELLLLPGNRKFLQPARAREHVLVFARREPSGCYAPMATKSELRSVYKAVSGHEVDV
jgi:hypothetical protein